MPISGKALLIAAVCAGFYFVGSQAVTWTKTIYHKTQHGIVHMLHPVRAIHKPAKTAVWLGGPGDISINQNDVGQRSDLAIK